MLSFGMLPQLLAKSVIFFKFLIAFVSLYDLILIAHTYFFVSFTPPCKPLENLPFPLPPARICAFITISGTSEK